LKERDADYGSDFINRRKRSQLRPSESGPIGIDLCFLRYLLLEDKRFADDRALHIGVIRGEVISACLHRAFEKQDRCAKGPSGGRA
jgi:hypothetical protein